MTMELTKVEDVGATNPDDIQLTLSAVFAECMRQDALARMGRFNGTHILPSGPDAARLAVTAEEFGEVAKEVTDAMMGKKTGYKDDLVKELLQLAACCVVWATCAEHERYPDADI